MTDDNLTANECKQARQGLNWSREKLARVSKVGARTIIDFENGVRQPVSATKAALKAALAGASVEFRGDVIVIPVINSKEGTDQ